MSAVVPKEETFENYELIDRKPFANYLTAFLNTKAEQGYVINLNAEWGAGKTTFLQCWYNELSKDHPTIYFDAWRSDFSKDAMLALIDCFHAQLANPIAGNEELIKSLFDKGSYFIRKSVPSLLVGYLKHKTGTPEDESLIEDINKQFGIEIAEKECGDALKDILKDILEQRQRVEGIKDFQEVLVKLAEAFVETFKQEQNPKQYPVYVLIDELDRCRPSYAIEIIESVKHFFNTKNFVFVIATDTEQLQHSVKAVYGEGFDAHSYLSRFFHKTVTLPAPSMEDYLISRLEPIVESDFEFDAPFLLDFLVGIFEWHNMTSLREVDKVIQDIEIAKSTESKSFKIIPLVLLSVLKRLHPQTFNNYIKSAVFPYRHENHNNVDDKHYLLPKNNNVTPIQINENTTIQFENALRYVLITLSKGVGNTNLNSLSSLGTHNQGNGVFAICDKYRLNPMGTPASKDGYNKILNLAGHFE
ncbi:KAP family P-loop NTPase fold protein [Flavobacterium beibuense]|uniref:KAP family P-loop NTPase fold protein n=1 Tax=Flavobacterium beibuense TaxID=657326 RepID=UPI003A8DA8AC